MCVAGAPAAALKSLGPCAVVVLSPHARALGAAIGPGLVHAQRMDHFMNGVEARKARADKCVVATTNALSALSDQAFMASFQRSSATSDGWALLKHLKKAFVANLESVGWMDRRTQAAALRKARKLSLNLGGPEAYKMLPYPVTAASYWNNSRCARVLSMCPLPHQPVLTTPATPPLSALGVAARAHLAHPLRWPGRRSDASGGCLRQVGLSCQSAP